MKYNLEQAVNNLKDYRNLQSRKKFIFNIYALEQMGEKEVAHSLKEIYLELLDNLGIK